MTEDLIKWINVGYSLRGLIMVREFDEKVEDYLLHYEPLKTCRYQRLVRDVDTKKIFLVIKASEASRGRRTSHLILDDRIDDELVQTVCLHTLVGLNRRVELF